MQACSKRISYLSGFSFQVPPLLILCSSLSAASPPGPAPLSYGCRSGPARWRTRGGGETAARRRLLLVRMGRGGGGGSAAAASPGDAGERVRFGAGEQGPSSPRALLCSDFSTLLSLLGRYGNRYVSKTEFQGPLRPSTPIRDGYVSQAYPWHIRIRYVSDTGYGVSWTYRGNVGYHIAQW